MCVRENEYSRKREKKIQKNHFQEVKVKEDHKMERKKNEKKGEEEKPISTQPTNQSYKQTKQSKPYRKTERYMKLL